MITGNVTTKSFDPSGAGFSSGFGMSQACGCGVKAACACGSAAISKGGPTFSGTGQAGQPNVGRIAQLTSGLEADMQGFDGAYRLYNSLGTRFNRDFVNRAGQAGYDPRTIMFAASRLYGEQQYTKRLGLDSLRLVDSALADVKHNILIPAAEGRKNEI
jgi:hypothetical protein